MSFMITLMLRLLRLVSFLVGVYHLVIENLALLQQLEIYKRTMARHLMAAPSRP
jgi:hypothetical protein